MSNEGKGSTRNVLTQYLQQAPKIGIERFEKCQREERVGVDGRIQKEDKRSVGVVRLKILSRHRELQVF